jgi:hypothetical protein
MILLDPTIDAFKKLSKFAEKIMVREGNILQANSDDAGIIGFINIDQEFPKEFFIANLKQFVATLSLFDKPKITFQNSFLELSDDRTSRTLKYFYSNPSQYKITSKTKSSFASLPIVTTFELSEESIKSAIHAAEILDLKFVTFKSDGDNIYLTVFNNNDTTNTFSEIICPSDSRFILHLDRKRLALFKKDARIEILQDGKCLRVKISDTEEYLIASTIVN